MSLTLEMIPPAGAIASQPYQGNDTTTPSRSLCGVATLATPCSWPTEVTVRFMPSGSRNSVRTNSSQLRPVAAGMISPAAMNMMF